jgi:cytochrome c553
MIQFQSYIFVVAVMLISLTSCSPKPAIKVPAEFEPGQNHFHRVCANCHGSDALGKQTRAPGLIDPEYFSTNYSNEEMYKQIVEGSDKMPPQRSKLSDLEVAEIIKYIRYSQKAADLVVDEDESDEDEDQ